MKRIYWCMLGIVLLLAASFIGYGVYLNSTGESNINARMADAHLHLRSVVATYRDIEPAFKFDNIVIQAEEVSDTVSHVEGTIVEVYVHKNQPVKVGDPLYHIVNNKLPLELAKAKNALARAEASAEQAELSYQRYEKLVELNAASMEKFDEARANYKATQAAVSEAQAQVDLVSVMEADTIVTAAVDGIVTIIYKKQGDFVQNGTPLCYIGNFSEMWFSCNMSDSNVRALVMNEGHDSFVADFGWSNLNKVYETEYAANNDGKDQQFPLTLQGIYPSLDKPATIRRVVWLINNSASILEPRSYNNVFICGNNKKKVFAIPRKALLDDSNDEVFVIKDGILERRTVKCGAIGMKYVEIISGLSEGEVVVTAVNSNLQEGAKATAVLEDE